jgi:cell division inhibitor SepF
MLNRAMRWFGLEDDDEEYETEDGTITDKDGNVVSFPKNKNSTIHIYDQKNFESVKTMAMTLKSRESAIVNLEFTDNSDAIKIIDFLSGCAFALDGSVHKLSERIFLFAVNTVDVQGEVSQIATTRSRK